MIIHNDTIESISQHNNILLACTLFIREKKSFGETEREKEREKESVNE